MDLMGNEIAVIGMDLRFPGCASVDEFLKNLLQGALLTRKLEANEIPLDISNNSQYVPIVSACPNYADFDYDFFGYTKKEALLMDPQQRLFLETCWKALEHAGYSAEHERRSMGVYGTSAYNTYLLHCIEQDSDFIKKNGFHDVMVGNDKDYMATRVAYKLGLTGPAINLQTACSSSLVAVHYACQGLLLGECDYALAGGVSVNVPGMKGYIYQPGFIMSADGHCRPFDKKSDGTVFGTGVGVVVLKRLNDAVEDQDNIYAVIRSTAVNNDGNKKIGYTAPSQSGQAEALRMALQLANIEPHSVTYIEAHGTATSLGDPIEMKAIQDVYGLASIEERQKYACGIGTVKSNFGHMDVASGIAGFIKTVLSLYYKTIFPTLHFQELNEKINFEDSRFYIANKKSHWASSGRFPRRAAVSSFGVGGTNAHSILEEYIKTSTIKECGICMQTVKISAKSLFSLESLTKSITDGFEGMDDSTGLNYGYTLNVGRADLLLRRYITVRTNVYGKHQKHCIESVSDVVETDEIKSYIIILSSFLRMKLSYSYIMDLYYSIPVFSKRFDDMVAIISSRLNDMPDRWLENEHIYMKICMEYPSWVNFTMAYALFSTFFDLLKKPKAIICSQDTLWAACGAAGFLAPNQALDYHISAQDVEYATYNDFFSELAEDIQIYVLSNELDEKENYSDEHMVFGLKQKNSCSLKTLGEEWNKENIIRVDVTGHKIFIDNSGDSGEEVEGGWKVPVQDVHETIFHIVGWLWQRGISVQWQTLYDKQVQRRIAAPTYPFIRQRFWYGKVEEYTSYLWQLGWGQTTTTQPLSVSQALLCESDNIIVIGSQSLLVKSVNERLTGTSARVEVIDDVAIMYPSAHGSLRINEEKLSEIIAGVLTVSPKRIYVVDLLQTYPDPNPNPAFDAINEYYMHYYYNGVILSRVLAKFTSMANVLLTTFSVTEKPRAYNVFTALRTGVLMATPMELPSISVKNVTFAWDAGEGFLESILMEIFNHQDISVMYDECGRNIPAAIPLRYEPESTIQLKQNGVYVITGGTGNVGLLFAKQIAMRVRCSIFLLSHSFDDSFLHKKPKTQKEKDIQGTIQWIKESGSEPHIIHASLDDRESLCRALDSVYHGGRAVDGVIHSAGIAGTASDFINNITFEKAVHFFDAKVKGAIYLSEYFKNKSLDFCIMISSNVATLGGIGDSAYSSANAFLRAFCQSLDVETYRNWVAVDFDSLPRAITDDYVIDGIRIGKYHTDSKGNFGKSLQENRLSSEDFYALFDIILNCVSKKSLIISKTRYDKRLQANNDVRGMNTSGYAYKKIPMEMAERNKLEKLRLLWHDILGEDLSDNENFFDAGGDSFLGIQLINAINNAFSEILTIQDIFEHSTINKLYKRLQHDNKTQSMDSGWHKVADVQKNSEKKDNRVAVIGMAGRFPGAESVSVLFENILNGKCSIHQINNVGTYDNILLMNRNEYNAYVGARGKINDISNFDYTFFGVSKTEAVFMDPQHRLFLQCCWEAMEDAGYRPNEIEQIVGVFGSACISTYLIHNIIKGGHLTNDPNNLALIGNSVDALAPRVSYLFDYKGPSKTVQTFCSSSAVAIHDAIASIENGECDMALAGGVNIVIPQEAGYMYNKSSIFSPMGELNPFDNEADGTIFSNGVGVVVLKRYADAVRDGDPIYGVILASEINNDGSEKAGFLSPSITGHAECIKRAYDKAGINPESLAYIEAHATGTRIGDPIEVRALSNAFAAFTDKKLFCGIGSVKGNIGHLDRAAGVVGLIKCMMILKNRLVPPTLYRAPNDMIPFEQSPFFLSNEVIAYQSSQPMRVAMSSLGVGGTNSHIVMQEYTENQSSHNKRDIHIIKLSAKSDESLRQYVKKLSAFLDENEMLSIKDMAYTLQVGRNDFPVRMCFCVKDVADLKKMLLQEGIQAQHIMDSRYLDTRVVIGFHRTYLNQIKHMRYVIKAEPIIQRIIKNEWSDFMDEDRHEVFSPEIVERNFMQVIEKYLALIGSRNQFEVIVWDDANTREKESNIHIVCKDEYALYEALCKIWNYGINIDWSIFNKANEAKRTHLPAYAFLGESCWLESLCDVEITDKDDLFKLMMLDNKTFESDVIRKLEISSCLWS